MGTYEEELKKKSSAANQNTNAYLTGVDKTTSNTINSAYQQSEVSKQADAQASAARDNLVQKANSSQSGIISSSNWNKINSQYNMSSAVSSAMDFTSSLLDKLSTGRTSYSDRVDEMINTIMNRKEFSYDPDTDTLFQNALSSAMNSGKSAMEDTMGQAASLTGGYGSSYATSAANQAYNAYVEDAYDNLPQYYQMALNTYQMESEDLYNKLGMLNTADDKEFNRTYTAWDANFRNWTQLYDMEYTQWRDSVSNALSAAGLELNENGQIFNQASSAYSALNDNANTQYSRDYSQYRDNKSDAFNVASLENSDYWNRQDQAYKWASLSQRGSGKSDKNESVWSDVEYINSQGWLEGNNGETVAKQYLADKGYDNEQIESIMKQANTYKDNADSVPKKEEEKNTNTGTAPLGEEEKSVLADQINSINIEGLSAEEIDTKVDEIVAQYEAEAVDPSKTSYSSIEAYADRLRQDLKNKAQKQTTISKMKNFSGWIWE